MRSTAIGLMFAALAAVTPPLDASREFGWLVPSVVVPYWLRLSDGTMVGAVYTPVVWNILIRDAPGATSHPGITDLVHIAYRHLPSPTDQKFRNIPFRLALTDAVEAGSWERPGAQHPVRIKPGTYVAATSGLSDLAKFDVVAEFRPAQFRSDQYVVLYRQTTNRGVGARVRMHFEGSRLPPLPSVK